jgi:NAD/NADP transhydrogenase alpha subunit
MRSLVDQLPMTNPQLPKQFTLGVGIWNLAVDTSFSALRLIVATMAVLMIGGSATLFACPVCFGAEESPLIDGAKLGVVALVAVTLAVQLGFVSFFLYLRKRAKQVAELDLEAEWLDLQRGPRSS